MSDQRETKPYGDPCPCCKHLLGCYCHEHPHRENSQCPGNIPDIRDPTASKIIRALIEFGDHLGYCAGARPDGGPCDCGRADAVNDARAFIGMQPIEDQSR